MQKTLLLLLFVQLNLFAQIAEASSSNFEVQPTDQNSTSINFYAKKQQSAKIGLGLYLGGLGCTYLIATPMSMINGGAATGGLPTAYYIASYTGSALKLSGAITVGVAATRATRTLGRERFSWGPFGAWAGLGATGTALSLTGALLGSPGMYYGGTALLIGGNICLLVHTIKAYKATNRTYNMAQSESKKVQWGVAPVILPKGGGLTFALQF